jgi:hypothetical protein
MAIQSNTSEESVAGDGGIPLYTGIAAVSVIAVNPTLEELINLGVPLKNEPEYTGVQISGDTFNKIVFWVRSEEPSFTTRLEILTKPETKVSSTGKTLWINNYGRTVYAENKASETYDWYKSDGEREAFHGEDVIMNFISSWANVANNGECYLETPKDIFNGKVEELKKLVVALKDNKVRVLLGVKNGQYQNIYSRHFGRIKPKRDDLFIKELNKDFGTFKSEYNSDLSLQKYNPELIVPDSAAPADNIKVEAASTWL